MTEAQLRVVASELFREMGMEDTPDSLDFFQKNAENGSSSEWKKCLKSPSTRVARRVSSDGTALVHLRKKYSTGLVSDQDQSTRSIKASDIEVSPVHGRSRKFSPSVKQKSRFGYVSSTAKVADATAVGKDSSETQPSTSCYSPEEGSKTKEESSKTRGMFKVKKGHGKATSVAAPVVASHSIKGVGPSKLPTSVSAGNISAVRPFGKSASNGAIPTRNGANSPTVATTASNDNKQPNSDRSGLGSVAKRDQSNRSPPNGESQSSIPRPGTLPTHNRSGSHGSAISFTANSTKKESPAAAAATSGSKKGRSISVVHNGIDTNKLSGVNMRSLTRARGVDETSTPERKTSDPSGAEKRQSFIPMPAQQAAGSGGGASTAGDEGGASTSGSIPRNVANGTGVTSTESSSGPPPARNNSGSNTQVLYSRKPSFKLVTMSSSSHRIMHTVQDGGPPKRMTSRASQPVLPVAAAASNPSVVSAAPTSARQSSSSSSSGGSKNSSIPRPAHGKAAKETVVLRHANEASTPQGLDGLERQNGYDSLPVMEIRSKEAEEKGSATTVSLQKQTKGEYDRLSPPVQNAQTSSKQGDEPFYDTVQDNNRVSDRSEIKERKTSVGLRSESHPSALMKLSPASTAGGEGRQLTSGDPVVHSTRPGLNQGSNWTSVTSSSGGQISGSKVLTESSKSKLPVVRKHSQENKAEKEPQASKKTVSASDKNDFGFQRKPSGGRRIPQSIPRYTSKSGDTYTLVNKTGPPAQSQLPTAASATGGLKESSQIPGKKDHRFKLPRSTTAPGSMTKDMEDRVAAVTHASSNNNSHTPHHTHQQQQVQRAHRPLQASLSDSSTSAARTTPISFKVSALSSESVGGESVRSAVSGGSSELEMQNDEPLDEKEREMDKKVGLVPKGGVAMMASVERRAKLAVNWSEQSLDRNMPGMITSTVEALGNLVEAISSPPAGNSSEDESGDDGGLKMRWYQAVDGEDLPGGLCVSISPVSSATTPSTSATSPSSLAKLERSGTHSPRDAVSPGDRAQLKAEAGSSKEVRGIPRPMKAPQKDLGGQKKSDKANITDEEVIPSVPARTVSLADKLSTQKGVVSDLSHLEPETKTIGASTSHTDGGVMSRIPPRRNTVGARPVNSTAPPLPPKSKPIKPPAPPPPATDDTVSQSESKSGIPAISSRFGFSSSSSSSSNPRPLPYRLTSSSKSTSRIKPSSSNKNPVQARSGSDQRPKRDKPKGGREWPAPAATSRAGLSTSKKAEPPNPLNHDYAVLEAPSDHDYAILDPEYHEEFYGYCESCTEPIIGMENGCLALERTYHIKCFTCSKCGMSLSEKKFYFSHGKLICEKDMKITYEQCRKCKRNIQDRVIKALGSSYHPDCFKCTICGKCLDGVHYTCDDKMQLFCIEDYHKVYAPKCAICDKSILPCNGQKKSLQVLAMNKSYHIQCYKCEQCHRQLASWTGGGEKCYPLNGHLLCRTCHSSRARSVNSSYTTPSPTSPEAIIC